MFSHPLLFPSNIMFPFLQNLIKVENCYQTKCFRNLKTETVKRCLLNLFYPLQIFCSSACLYQKNFTARTFEDTTMNYEAVFKMNVTA